MKLNITKEISLVICLKIIALAALWFFFVRGHVVPHGVQETSQHILSIINTHTQV